MDYFDTKLKRVYTKYGIVERGLPLDNTILSSVGIYPIRYDYVEYDEYTQKMLPGALFKDKLNGNVYVQKFKVEGLSDIELEQAQERKHRVELSEEEKTLLKYLDDTDWYVVRNYETDVLMPADVKTKREEARLRIDEIRLELNPSQDV